MIGQGYIVTFAGGVLAGMAVFPIGRAAIAAAVVWAYSKVVRK